MAHVHSVDGVLQSIPTATEEYTEEETPVTTEEETPVVVEVEEPVVLKPTPSNLFGRKH